MQTTMITRNIANPRRTILVAVQDAEESPAVSPASAQRTAAPVVLPLRTANPRRTVLVDQAH